MKKAIRIITSLLLCSFFLLFSFKDIYAEQGKCYAPLSSFYDVRCEVSFAITSVPHILLNKYDVDVYFDEKKLAGIKNGSSVHGTVLAIPGVHKFVFKKSTDNSVMASHSIDILKDEAFSCDIDCDKKDIIIKNVKHDVAKGSKAPSYPWRYDSYIAQANSFLYDQIIGYSGISQTVYDCFSVFFPDDVTYNESVYYAFVKVDDHVKLRQFAEKNGYALNEIFSPAGIKVEFVFADMDGKLIDEYDSNGNPVKKQDFSTWQSQYIEEFWGK